MAAGVSSVILLACISFSGLPQPSHDKGVWNYDGGIVLVTDGSIPNGPCFRVKGRVTARHFFDNLKRIDNETSGTTFRRGNETLTHFPDQVTLGFVVYDHPCSSQLNSGDPPRYLTRPLMSSLNLYLFWKHGVDLRPITDAKPSYFSVDPAASYVDSRARGLPERLVWSYEFQVPSAGVPLTDSLVLVLRTSDGHIVARVAARM
jgi:hypothetical protein